VTNPEIDPELLVQIRQQLVQRIADTYGFPVSMLDGTWRPTRWDRWARIPWARVKWAAWYVLHRREW
jgi:hypothetical protein